MVFWHAVKEVGLLDEVVEDFQNQVQEVLKGLHERVCDPPLQVKGGERRRYALYLLSGASGVGKSAGLRFHFIDPNPPPPPAAFQTRFCSTTWCRTSECWTW